MAGRAELCLEIYRRLEGAYRLSEGEFVGLAARGAGLFEFLVAVVLSQNTSDRNAIAAYRALKGRLGKIEPELLLSLGEGELAELVRPAGMHRQRARRLLGLARAVLGAKDLEARLASLGEAEARELLLSLPGVGEKTADVVLLAYFGKRAFPVDTHILRVTERLGLAPRRYSEASRAWLECLPRDKLLRAHLLLIQHGRQTCKARRPECWRCPLADLCEFARQSERRKSARSDAA